MFRIFRMFRITMFRILIFFCILPEYIQTIHDNVITRLTLCLLSVLDKKSRL